MGIESLEKQLAEKTATLAQKDTDLREAIQNVAQMQRDNMEQMTRERQRAEALEESGRLLKQREADLSSAVEASRGEVERLGAELGACKAELGTCKAELSYSNTERERLAIETCEQKEALEKKGAECAALDAKLQETSSSLASASASLGAKSEQVVTLMAQKHEVEVEFKAYKEHHGTVPPARAAASSQRAEAWAVLPLRPLVCLVHQTG